MAEPYYSHDGVTIYHGDAREIDAWDVPGAMVTDPPYGRNWRQGALNGYGRRAGIAGDSDTSVRDVVLARWAPRPALVFGDLMLAPPLTARHVLVFRKPNNAGIRGAIAGFRRDAEAIYVIGDGWASGIGGRSCVIETIIGSQGNPYSPAGLWGHPHAKPVDVIVDLVDLCPPSAMIVDPFAGSGTTLVAAKRRGRRAIGVEIEERYCETAAKRLAQGVLDLSSAPATA